MFRYLPIFITFIHNTALNYNNERYDKVIPYLQMAYNISPKDIETLYNISIVLYNIGDYRGALKYLDQMDNKNNEILELEKILKEKIR
ncbi:hypothetical protein SAMN04487886_11578 [Clostridium sp. DSM 8431]|nr:hypothetical protein SAMN04487886_11578 [Clostridium sp. DSM 8431]